MAIGEPATVRMSVAKVINHELFNIIGEKAYDIALIKLHVCYTCLIFFG